VLAEINYCINVLGVIIVSWCTDASGESSKMRRLLRRIYKWIVTLDCWAHQVRKIRHLFFLFLLIAFQFNLVVGDYFKLKLPFIKIIDEALEVVKWFNNHSRALGMLREEELAKGLRILVLILPVLTRWTSHYLCMRRLLALEYCFRVLSLDPAKREALILCAGPKLEQKRKAEQILAIIDRASFWADLKTCVILTFFECWLILLLYQR
jgi:hypothetical protein